jgi:uncharacterized glyoxalase superfamily protein PhnB
MDYKEYREKFYVEPQPEPRFRFSGLAGYSVFVKNYDKALAYYKEVFGPPAYVEGESTHGWRIGEAWFTLFPARKTGPRRMEVTIMMDSVEEAERLHAAFLAAGGTGAPPSDELMYEPVRFCSVKDPFGSDITIIARRPE